METENLVMDHHVIEVPNGSESPTTPRIFLPWLMWGATASFVVFQFFLQLSSGEIVAGLMQSFSIGALGSSLLASMYYYVYVALQTPVGVLIDRFGPRRLLSIGALVCACGSLTFGLSHHLLIAAMGRLLMGAGAAFAWVGSIYIISRWFPPQRFSLMVAFAEAVGMIGILFGGFFLATLVQNMGWRQSMIDAAVILGFIGFIIALIVRDTPAHARSEISVRPNTLKQDFKILMKNSAAWVNGIYSGLVFAVFSVFIALWAIPFMQLAHHLTLVMSTVICNLVFVGALLGGPAIGWLDSKIISRRRMLMICTLSAALLLSLLIYIPALPLAMVMVMMILLGFFSSVYVLTFSISNEIVPSHMRGTSAGFVNTLSMITAPLFQPLVGYLLHLLARHSAEGVEHYSVHSYQMALTILPILVLLAAVLVKWMPVRKF